MPADAGPQPELVSNLADFRTQLDRLRRRAARQTGRRASLDVLVRTTGIPRSTLHAYLSGSTLAPPDKLDVIVQELGCNLEEVKEWAQALDRVAEWQQSQRLVPTADVTKLPTTNARARSARALGLIHCRELLDHGSPAPAGSTAATAADPGSDPLPAVVIPTWTGTYVYAEPDASSTRTGFLHAGNNWYVGQTQGAPNPVLEEGVRSDVWLYTQSDVAHDRRGGWGWAPATALICTRGPGLIPGVVVLGSAPA